MCGSHPTRILHFVYSVPRGTLAHRAWNRISAATGFPPPHRWGTDALISWKHPIRAPHSISYNLLHALKQCYHVRFYSMYERGRIALGPHDIFLGQPVPVGNFTYGPRSATDDPESIVSKTIRTNPHNKNKFLIMPFANDEGYIGWAKRVTAEADGLVLIGGELWRRDFSATPLGDLRARPVVGVNMGIDERDYPLIKTHFNPAGKRRYLYIGHTGGYKNIAALEDMAATIPGFEGGHIGIGNIRGWKKLSDFTELSPAFMHHIADEYDIGISCSSADPQATTILEQMCFGFPIACTPETGYELPSIVQLSVTDAQLNREQLRILQTEPEEALHARARQNREYALRCHGWKDFTESVMSFVL